MNMDFTEIFCSPEFMTTVVVIRRCEDVNGYGEVTPSRKVFSGVGMIITAASGNTMAREADKEYLPRSYTAITNFAVQGIAPGRLPDVVYYLGDYHVVKTVDPYPTMGPGFMILEIESMDHVDANLRVDGGTGP